MNHRYYSENQLVCLDEKDALTIASILMKNDYCVLLSKEDNLTIVNYEYSQYSNRNYVIFRSLEEWELEEIEEEKDE